MKPTMIFALAMMTLIILMSSFGVHFGNIAPTVHLKSGVSAADVLYVCPAASNGWDSAAGVLRTIQTPLWIIVFFALMMLLFAWGWSLYQNLLKDKFNKNSFLKPWAATKIFFWAVVILVLVIHTPNHYRTVHVRGVDGNFVLCENNTPNRPEWKNVMDGHWPKAAMYKNVQN
ncbi:MAG: hypothetical protein J5608_02090 [Alphaproteobacteria bacterium]|nr:hypothetical protein [Alphaproteobacteria bacterium]